MEIKDPRGSRAEALAGARGRLRRLKLAAVAGSTLTFAGMSAGLFASAAHTVAPGAVATAAAVVPAMATTATTPGLTTQSTTNVAAPGPATGATPTPAAAPVVTTTTTTRTPIVSAQS